VTLEILDQVAQVGHRRQDHHFDARQRQAGGQFGDQARGESAGAMEFPVSGYDLAAHRVVPCPD
jgi:hypothetical protein